MTTHANSQAPRLRRALAVLTRKGWMHWVRFLGLLAVGSYVGHWLEDSDRFEDIRDSVYQMQIRMQRHGQLYPQYTVLVLLDDDDFWSERYAGREPVRRDRVAELVDKLNAAGANIVALDFDLRSSLESKPDYEFPEYVAEDHVLEDAVARMCAAGRHVVLSSSVQNANPPQKDGVWIYREVPSIYTADLPKLPCVARGYIQLPSDMRQVPGQLNLNDGSKLDSLALAIVRVADPIAYAAAVRGSDAGRSFRYGQYLTEEDYRPREGRRFIYNGTDVLTMDPIVLRQAMADKTVIVGGSWHSAAYGQGRRVDMWLSPAGVEPGAMLHANYVEALRDRIGTFAPLSGETARYLEWALVFALGVLSLLEIHSGWKWSGFALGLLLSLLLTYVLLQNAGLFLDFFIPLLMVVAHTVFEEFLELRHHLHHLRQQVHALSAESAEQSGGH